MTCRVGGDALLGLDDCDEDSSTSGGQCPASGGSGVCSTSSSDDDESWLELSGSAESAVSLAALQALFFSLARLKYEP